MQRLNEFKNTKTPLNFHNASSSLSADIISLVFHEEPTEYLEDPDFNSDWIIAAPILRHFLEKMTYWRIWDDKARRQMFKSKMRPSNMAKSRSSATLIDHLYDDISQIMSRESFTRTAQLIQQGAVHNFTNALAMTLFFVLRQDDSQEKLRKELEPIFDKQQGCVPKYVELEKLPYLSACLKEGLRLGTGNLGGIPRVSPDQDIHFNEWIIPKGTAVSMSSYWMHVDPDIFPNPDEFNPSRWIDSVDNSEHMKQMLQSFVPFGKGSRSCIGVQLAYVQLYHTMAHLFRPGSPRLLLHETEEHDIKPVRGLLFTLPREGARGLRLQIVDP
ncbi:cytochrome P450 [Aspergillus taichungensis]|uniref:Cytochrome P450 n=1 Tax=Aspergillus taichungensis TaxID=482145 RepID=A0A2J5HGX3_9EURO|nr:cytochrome P450 [Aspergillus taichungensis]